MEVTRIEFLVPGPPIPQPRPRIGLRGGKPRVYRDDSHPVHAYKQHVRLVARQSYHGSPLEGPVSVSLAFLMPRPLSKVWKRQAMPREPHIGRPDLDNLEKSVLDAVLGVLWVDDAQVCRLTATKQLAAGDESPGVYAVVEIMNDITN